MIPARFAEQLRTVAAAGATEITPAIELARQWLSAYPMARRHVLLVSDGRSSPADAERLWTLVRDGRFRLSVISLGADRDRQFLSALALAGGGRAYFPDDERELPAIAAREAARVAGGRIVEEAFTPRTSAHRF
jgi:Mg-chelatase subunit ChlD